MDVTTSPVEPDWKNLLAQLILSALVADHLGDLEIYSLLQDELAIPGPEDDDYEYSYVARELRDRYGCAMKDWQVEDDDDIVEAQ